MKGKIMGLILIVIALILIADGIWVHYHWHQNKTTQEEKQEIPSGVDYDENIEEWRTSASTETMELIKEIYPEDYEFEFSINNKFSITLENLQHKSGKNFNIYSKYGISCDLSKSEFVVELDQSTKEKLRILNLVCEPVSRVRTVAPTTQFHA